MVVNMGAGGRVSGRMRSRVGVWGGVSTVGVRWMVGVVWVRVRGRRRWRMMVVVEMATGSCVTRMRPTKACHTMPMVTMTTKPWPVGSKMEGVSWTLLPMVTVLVGVRS